MTILDVQPGTAPVVTDTPTVIDGEVVYRHADLAPPRNPHRFSTRASAAVLLIAAVGALANVDSDGTARAINVAVLAGAFVLYLSCLFRFHARAEAGDR